MKISLIIPFYGKWQMTNQRLMEIYKFVDPATDLKILLINDKPQDDSCDGSVNWWKKESPLKIRYIKNKKNLGFGGSMNKGARKAKGDILIFFSNDVVISGDFIREVVGAISADEKRLVGGRYLDFDTGWNLMYINGKRMLFPYVEGWLIACTRFVWNELEGFDPLYEKFDVEDIDLSTMALHKGFKLHGLDSPYLRHLSGQTIRGIFPDRERYTNANIQKFKDKWSKLLK